MNGASPPHPEAPADSSRGGPRTSGPLKSRLFLLAASGLVPLAIMIALALGFLIHQRQQTTQRSAQELSRALATAADAELRSTVSLLRVLSDNEDLAAGRLEQFHASAARLARQQGWRGFVLADDTGQALFRTTAPFGTAEPHPVDPESMAKALATRQPIVGTVKAVQGPDPRPAFAVRLPADVPDGRTYVLSAVLTADQILGVVKRQSVPQSWVVAVLDQSGQRVARSKPISPAANAGRPTPSLQALLSRGHPEGTGVTYTLEGVESHTGYSRLPDWGWVVAVAIPASEASQAGYGSVAAVLVGLAASLALSAYLGRFFARRVTRPIDILKRAAAALGRGEKVRPEPLGIAELDEVGRALALASQQRERSMQELTQAQAEREALLGKVTDALRAAEEAGRAKDEFLAVLGHELRNPLAPIAMALQLMSIKGGKATDDERRVVERQLAHMTRLVDDLLDVSRITGKRLAMRMTRLRLVDLIEQAADTIRPSLASRILTVDTAARVDAAWVWGDEARLAQVFNNILGNAIKFTGEEGRIAIRTAVSGDAVEVEVRDNGSGMLPEVLKQAFDPFFQERQGADRSRGGLGLGLAIVKSLVEMHGGSVGAASEGQGRGTRISLRLPLASPPAQPEPAPAPPPAAGAGKVLVVDDNHDAADTAATLLEITGYETRVAYDPAAALALLDDYVPNVAVLDIGLPGMSGYELARRFRAHPNGVRCRLVALTGYGQADDVAMAMKHGFDTHLAKPAAPDVLLERIGELMPAQP